MIVKFPYSASRRVFSPRQRRSKNGTPEAAAASPQRPAATVAELPRRAAVDRASLAAIGAVAGPIAAAKKLAGQRR